MENEQFDMEEFKCKNVAAMCIGLTVGAVVGFFIILVALIKHFLF